MNEVEYVASIDACFPYDDQKLWKATIDRAIAISDNAAYMALHEICGAPPGVPRKNIERMLQYWESRYEHPAKNIVLAAARTVVRGASLPEEDILRYLDSIKEYSGLYAALGIIWWAAPRGKERPWETTIKIEHECSEIIEMWGRDSGRATS